MTKNIQQRNDVRTGSQKLFLDGITILLPTNVHLLLQKSYNFCCEHKLGNRESVKEISVMAELDMKETPRM